MVGRNSVPSVGTSAAAITNSPPAVPSTTHGWASAHRRWGRYIFLTTSAGCGIRPPPKTGTGLRMNDASTGMTVIVSSSEHPRAMPMV